MTKNRVAICLAVVIILFQSGVLIAQLSMNELNDVLGLESFPSNFYLIADIGENQTSYKLERRKDWGESFLPLQDWETFSSVNPSWTLGFGLGYTKILIIDRQSWQVRLPISYQVFSLGLNDAHACFAKEQVAGTVLNRSVMVNDLIVEHFTPKVGIEIVRGSYGIGFSVQHYRLMLRDYLEEYNWSGVNASKVISSRQIESGVSFQVELFFARSLRRSYSVYMETMGGFKTVSFGLIGYLSVF